MRERRLYDSGFGIHTDFFWILLAWFYVLGETLGSDSVMADIARCYRIDDHGRNRWHLLVRWHQSVKSLFEESTVTILARTLGHFFVLGTFRDWFWRFLLHMLSSIF